MEPNADWKGQRRQSILSTGLYVMTARHASRYGGATLTWVCQASSHPPLIMAAIPRDSNVFRCMSESRRAALHVLSPHLEDLPAVIAPARSTIQPGFLECHVVKTVDDGGDRALVILEIMDRGTPNEEDNDQHVPARSWV